MPLIQTEATVLRRTKLRNRGWKAFSIPRASLTAQTYPRYVSVRLRQPLSPGELAKTYADQSALTRKSWQRE